MEDVSGESPENNMLTPFAAPSGHCSCQELVTTGTWDESEGGGAVTAGCHGSQVLLESLNSLWVEWTTAGTGA
jgi:hypothetical protein